MAEQAAKKSNIQVKSPSVAVQPNIILRQNQQFRMDRYKLKVAMMQKNLSWKKDQPELHPTEHAHFFLSHSEQGLAHEHCVPVGGHFHLVKTYIDGEGNLKAECGPALRKIEKKLPNGKIKKVIEPVKFKKIDESNDSVEKYAYEVDNHTHEVDYIGSEFMSVAAKKQIQDSNKAAIQSMGIAAPQVMREPGSALENDAGSISEL